MQPSDEQVVQFVHYLREVAGKLASPPPEEIVELHKLIHGLEPRDRPDFAQFHRMGDVLRRRSNPTMGELSQALGVPLSTATRMANWWVDSGYARRLADPDDRRIVRLTLTERGNQLMETLETRIVRAVEQVLGCLSPGEQETLITLFGKVATNLRDSQE